MALLKAHDISKDHVRTLKRCNVVGRNGFGIGIFTAIECAIVGEIRLMMASKYHSNEYVFTAVTPQIPTLTLSQIHWSFLPVDH